MTLKLAWVVLPLLLFALVLGMKWRAEHPPVTQQDLEVRALMQKSLAARFDYSLYNRKPSDIKGGDTMLASVELRPFIECFHLLPYRAGESQFSINPKQSVQIFCLFGKSGEANVNVYVDVPARTGTVITGDLGRWKEYKLHPVTTKRWLELMLNHPRIGPELRARMAR